MKDVDSLHILNDSPFINNNLALNENLEINSNTLKYLFFT